MNQGEILGAAISPGLALGPVHIVHVGPDVVPTWSVSREEIPVEVGRLASALNAAAERLEDRRRKVAETAGEKDAEIFAVHRMILQDPGAMREVESAVMDERINAEAAVQRLIDRFEATLGGLQGSAARAYAADVSDPWRLVLEVLLERDRAQVLRTQEKVIVAAAELTPQIVTYLEREQVLAVIAETGARFSHGAVLARAFGIPSVVGLPNLLARLEQGMMVAVDGDRGCVQLRPSSEQMDAWLERKASFERRRQTLHQDSVRPAVTPDGRSLQVLVNIESVRDLDNFDLAQTDGVGLLRTEFLYLERNEFPSEEEQYRLYRRVLERMEGRPVTFRLLDIGGDKPLPYFKTPPETNPALGWRGIRITLQWLDLLRVQLRALLRASMHGDLRILLPMVTSLEEIQRVHDLFDDVREQLRRQGYETAQNLPVGSMIEVPSTLFTLERFVQAVDFVSVGTNDLVQYLLAVDRDNSWVSSLYDPHHPAVVRALRRVVDAAHAAGRPASVCGDMASDPATAILLLGMGYDAVSVAPQFLPEIKYAIRRVAGVQAAELADQALAGDDSESVRAVLERIRGGVYAEEQADRFVS